MPKHAVSPPSPLPAGTLPPPCGLPTEQLASLLDHLGDGLIATDPELTITFWNRKAVELLGKTAEETIGRKFLDIYHSSKAVSVNEKCRQAIDTGETIHFEEHILYNDSWLEVSLYPSEYGLSVYFRNISERKHAELEWRISTERYEFVSQATSDIVWDWNLATRALYINQSFTRNLGYILDEYASPQQLWYDHLHPADKDRVIADQLRALRDPAVSYWEDTYAFFRADGTVAVLKDRAVIMRDSDGKAVRMTGAAQDISGQWEAEQQLEKTGRRFRAMVQSGLDIVLLLDKNFSIQYISPNAFDISGYLPADLQGVLALEPIHPDDVASIFGGGLQLLNQKKVVLPHFRYRMKDGIYRWLEATLSNYLTDESIAAIIVNVRDITDRKEIEEAIRLSENKYKLLFYQSPVPKWIYRHDTLRFVDVNDAALLHYGYSRQEFLDMTILQIRPPAEQARTNNLIKRLGTLPERRNIGIWKHLKKNGQEIDVEVTTHGLHLASGFHVIAEATDVTARMELEQLLIEEKVTAQKEIAKAIINTQEQERSEIGKELHDNVNQLLTTTKLYIENIHYFPEQRTVFIEKSATLVQKAITEIRSLSRALVTPTIYDIGFRATLDELIEHYQALEVFAIRFRFEAKEEKIDKGMKLTIYRIIQEQLNNIVKYAGAAEVAISITHHKARLNLSIQDDGKGFDAANKKPGLGLNNIKNRAEVFKGVVKIQSRPGEGCLLAISFPVSS